MRRFMILILLMIAIPFQFSWAAAAVYCQHEQGGSHFGHHGHQHQSPSDGGADRTAAQVDKQADKHADKPADKKADSKPAKVHSDCESCHLFSHASVLPAAPPQPHASAHGHPLPPAAGFLSHIPAPPKRPDWPRLAVLS